MNSKTTIIALSLLLLAVLLTVFFLKPKFQSNPEITTPSPSFTSTSGSPKETPLVQNNPDITPTPLESSKPVITSPQSGSKVSSPLIVKGSVPAGWMFEGVFPIKLTNVNNEVIVQTQAKEVVPGSWSSSQRIDFTATLAFSTQENSGFIVLEKDNPSGLPENADSYKIPVNF